MSSIYCIDNDDVDKRLSVISKMYSLYRYRIFKHFKKEESTSEIVFKMSQDSLHPSYLIALVSTDEELGLMPSALIIFIKEYYRL